MIKNYKIKQQISQKAGRSTYLAEDSETDRKVVIKILEFNDLFNWDDLKLFEREAKTLKNLHHSHIPKFLDYFEIDEADRQGFALVQTYINAPSLKELIEQGIHFSETEIIEIAGKLLDILNYLHQLNPPVIHRDIKPSNILLTNRSAHSVGDIYLVDFGSVQTIAKKESGTITIVGSYGYIPLEQFMGKTSFASDLYSLGMTLIYLVTGIHPAELIQDTGQVQFDNSKISKSFAIWLQKITEPYLEKRYKWAELALSALHSSPQEMSENKLFKPQHPKLYIKSDRKRLITIYLEKTKKIRSSFMIVFSILGVLGVLVVFKVFGLIIIGYILLVLTTMNREKNHKQKNITLK